MNTELKIETGSPIKKFVNQTLKEIEAGLPKGYGVQGPVNFELNVVSKGEKSGGLNLQILNLGGRAEKENTQKVKFSIVNRKQLREDLRNVKKIFKNLGEGLVAAEEVSKNGE